MVSVQHELKLNYQLYLCKNLRRSFDDPIMKNNHTHLFILTVGDQFISSKTPRSNKRNFVIHLVISFSKKNKIALYSSAYLMKVNNGIPRRDNDIFV